MDIRKMYPNCRTCLKEIHEQDYCKLNDAKALSIRTQLSACVPELTVELVTDPVICTECIGMLDTAYEFRKRCIATEKQITSFIKTHKSDPEIKKLNIPALLSGKDDSKSFDLLEDLNSLLDDALQNTPISVLLSEAKKESETEVENVPSKENVIKLQTEMTPEDKKATVIAPESTKEFKAVTVKSENVSVKKEPNASPPQKAVRRKVFCCGFCSYKTFISTNYKTHLKNHEWSKPFACLICKYRFTSEAKLRLHVSKGCQVQTSFRSELPRSLVQPSSPKLTQQQPIKRLINSPKCKKPLSEKKIKLLLPKQEPNLEGDAEGTEITCHLCGLCFKHRRSLANHMRRHEHSVGVACNFCTFVASDDSHLRQHIRSHRNKMHGDVTMMKKKQVLGCMFCDFKTSKRAEQLQHSRTVHADKQLKCLICDFMCILPKTLHRHMAFHVNQANLADNAAKPVD